MKWFLKTTLAFLSMVGLFSIALFAHAAIKTQVTAPQIPPQVILTWNASNFYPSNFRGKALPTIDTPITVSAEMLVNGKFADLSKANMVWYKSGEQIFSEVGLTQIKTSADSNDLENIFIRVEVTLGDSTTEQSILIPVTQPAVAIEIPYPHAAIIANSDVNLRAVPYFFNIASLERLIFYWQVGDTKKNMGSINSISLKISTPYSDAQKKISVSSYVQNKDDPTSIIKTDATLFIQ